MKLDRMEFRDASERDVPPIHASGGSPYQGTPSVPPPFTIGGGIKSILMGLSLRCPSCDKGKLFKSYFKMNQHCPNCGVQLEPEQGAYVGAMYLNILVTEAIFVVVYIVLNYGYDLSVLPELAILVPLNGLFPILFYPRSKGLWAGVLYLAGDLQRDEPEVKKSSYSA
jgi:uncharacterized protein (DUF983 family)